MTVVDDIKAQLDILEVVAQRVSLQRSGRSYKANCPFHQEQTPSFHVFPERQSWRCFGACATGGDVFSFVMKADNLDFGEALRQLSHQTGIALPKRGISQPKQDTAYAINEKAKSFFQLRLASVQGAETRKYLNGRGVERQAIESFEIGLSPTDGESLRNHLIKEGYSAQELVRAGVLRTGSDGLYHDLFRSRLMFPIRDAAGQLVGFGGRSLDASEPKYLNSPQGDVFDKSRLLYGLDRAKGEIRKNGAVVVEGYMDAIAAHQAGFTNVVASMGTALTDHQVSAISRLTGQVLMALDQDTAGQQATLRSLESSWRIYQNKVSGRSQGTTLLQRQEIPELRILTLPEGQDPDEVIHRSPTEWGRLLERSQPLIEYMISTDSSHLDASTPQGKVQIVEAVFPLIAAVTEGTLQDHYFQMLADRLNVSLETLRASVGRPRTIRRTSTTQPRATDTATSPFSKLNNDPLEEYCLALLLRHPDLKAKAAEHLKAEFFRRHENREIFNLWLLWEPDAAVEQLSGAVLDETGPEILEQLHALERKILPQLDPAKRREAVSDVISRLEERDLRGLKAEEEIRFAESPPDLDDGEHENILSLNRRIKRNEGLRRGLYQEISS